MSTERPDNDVTGPRRRRPPLAVASVAAAVLLAGGGGAYWASTASGEVRSSSLAPLLHRKGRNCHVPSKLLAALKAMP